MRFTSCVNYRYIYLLLCIFCASCTIVQAQTQPKELSIIEERLQRVDTDTPRETMASFMRAMNKYREGTLNNDPDLMEWINDAVRCLDTRLIDGVASGQSTRDSAIYLKEVIDRAIKINLNYIPDSREETTWTLKDTEIKIVLIQDGDRAGEFLFSQSTVARAREFFDKVDDLPYVKGSGMGAGFRQPWLERSVPAWTRENLFGIAYWQWIGLSISILFGFVIRLIIKGLGAILYRLPRHTTTDWDDTLVESEINPISLLASSAFWWASLYILRFEGMPLKVLTVLVQITLTVSVIWVFYALADTVSKYLKSLAERTSNTLDDQIVKLISRTMKAFVIIMGAMIGLENLGIEVYQLLAGLGIGGLAIALAAKDSLSNFFASITIMIDRPFQVGHWIKVGDADGTVEDVGFRSTKIRTFYNSLVSIPNSEIANTGVDNMGLRQYRRVKTFLGVTYDTPSEKIEAFLEGIKKIIQANPHTRKDYFHVVFNDHGPSSLDIMVYFFLSVPD